MSKISTNINQSKMTHNRKCGEWNWTRWFTFRRECEWFLWTGLTNNREVSPRTL